MEDRNLSPTNRILGLPSGPAFRPAGVTPPASLQPLASQEGEHVQGYTPSTQAFDPARNTLTPIVLVPPSLTPTGSTGSGLGSLSASSASQYPDSAPFQNTEHSSSQQHRFQEQPPTPINHHNAASQPPHTGRASAVAGSSSDVPPDSASVSAEAGPATDSSSAPSQLIPPASTQATGAEVPALPNVFQVLGPLNTDSPMPNTFSWTEYCKAHGFLKHDGTPDFKKAIERDAWRTEAERREPNNRMQGAIYTQGKVKLVRSTIPNWAHDVEMSKWQFNITPFSIARTVPGSSLERKDLLAVRVGGIFTWFYVVEAASKAEPVRKVGKAQCAICGTTVHYDEQENPEHATICKPQGSMSTVYITPYNLGDIRAFEIATHTAGHIGQHCKTKATSPRSVPYFDPHDERFTPILPDTDKPLKCKNYMEDGTPKASCFRCSLPYPDQQEQSLLSQHRRDLPDQVQYRFNFEKEFQREIESMLSE